MLIREAEETDIPKIVQVLKASLGETVLPVSKEIWYFKHVQNPFGASLVLVAEENGELIGVRAFMSWQWQFQNKVFSAYRAVDTATHPDHQGKGIFKKLTLKALSLAEEQGDHFIFNTPNDQSRPGYLKMGWKPAGKLRVGLRPVPGGFFKIAHPKEQYAVQHDCSPEELHELCTTWNSTLTSKNQFFTPKSPSFLKWRYEKNPLQQYKIKATPDFYLAVYIKKRKKLRELRVAECIIKGDKKSVKEARRMLSVWSGETGAHFISFAPQNQQHSLFVLKGNFGPILTVRKLNLEEPVERTIMEIPNWSYTLGDLELF